MSPSPATSVSGSCASRTANCRPAPARWLHDSGAMIRIPFRSASRVPPLPAAAASWFAPWLVALMVYLASLAGIGLILIDETLRVSENLLADRLTVQVPAEASA